MSLDKLRAFLQAEMPQLFDQLASLPMPLSPRILNAATGLKIKPGDRKEESSALYLEALQLEKDRGTLALGALARGMKEASKVIAERGQDTVD